MSPRWKKIAGDVRGSGGRFAMMVAAMAVSSGAVAAMLSSYAVLSREVKRNYLATNPAAAQLEFRTVDEGLMDAIRRQPEVLDAEAASTISGRVQVAPGEWLPLRLFVIRDFARLRINTVRSESGAWPPPAGAMLVERSALPLTRARVGGAIEVDTRGGLHSLKIAGVVHDAGLAPAWQEQTVYGYIQASTLAMIGEPPDPRLVKITLRKGGGPEEVEGAVRRVAAALAAEGRATEEIRIPPPGRHPHESQMHTMLTMLLMFSLLGLVLGAILSAATIGGMLAQQVRQLAVLKAIGARSRQIVWLYEVLVGAAGAVAAAMGVPLGLSAGRGLNRAVAWLLNLNLGSEAAPWWVAAVTGGLSIGVPVLLALIPIRAAARTTVARALADYGVSRTAAENGWERWLARWRGPDAAVAMAFRNAFRRRGRLLLTLLLLASAGAMFMGSLNLNAAWRETIDAARAARHYQVELRLRDAAPEAEVLAAAAGVSGAAHVEVWNTLSAAPDTPGHFDIVRTYPDGGHGSLSFRSAPAGTDFTEHFMLGGRWLKAGDAGGAVLNHMASALLPDARVGGRVALMVAHRPVELRVVGIQREWLTPAAIYVTPETFAAASGLAGRANAFRVRMREGAGAAEATRAIEQALAQRKIGVAMTIPEELMEKAQAGHVKILIFVLMAMAVAMAAVGALGLASAMSASVVERTREFGVMRAIGARSRVVLRTVLAEGVFTAALSWLIAVPVSIVFCAGAGRLVGWLSFRAPLPLHVSPAGAGLWLVLVLAGAALATALPARQAARLTIRETLAVW